MAFPPALDGSDYSVSEAGSGWASSVDASDSASEYSSNTRSTYVPPARRGVTSTKIDRLKIELEELQLGNQIADARKEGARHAGPLMPVLYLPFFVPKEKMSAMQSAFPRTTFRCTADTAHDHPWAHTETMIATNSALRLVPGGHTIIDVFGKPSAGDKFVRSQARSHRPKVMIGYQAKKTERDYVRALDWGNEVADDGRLRYIVGNGSVVDDSAMPITADGVTIGGVHVPGNELTWLCNHTFYYLTDEQIARMLKPKGSRMLAVVLKHSADNGNMFMGEMTYSRERGMVEQVNVHTGERYLHRDVSYLWTSKEKVVRTEHGSYAWTFHMVSDSTWIVRVTGVPDLDERFVARSKHIGLRAAAWELNDHDQSPTLFNHPRLAMLPCTTVTMFGSIPVVQLFGREDLKYRLTNLDFFEYLASKMVGRPRNPEIHADLFAIARSACDTVGTSVGGRSFRVAWSDIADHVALAFLSGIERETELLRAIEAYSVARKEHTNLANGRSIFKVGFDAPETLGKSVLTTAKHFNQIRKSTDVFTGFLEAID